MEVQGISGMQASQMEQIREMMEGTRQVVDGIVQGAVEEAGLSVEISDMGRGMKELEALLASDPQAFQDLMTKIADKLAEAATEKDGMEAQFLTDLSERFQQAGETGDLTLLRPPRPPMAYGQDGKPIDGPPPPMSSDEEDSLLQFLDEAKQ